MKIKSVCGAKLRKLTDTLMDVVYLSMSTNPSSMLYMQLLTGWHCYASHGMVAGQTDRAKRACKGLLETRPAQSMAPSASQPMESLEERLKLYRYRPSLPQVLQHLVDNDTAALDSCKDCNGSLMCTIARPLPNMYSNGKCESCMSGVASAANIITALQSGSL